MDNPSSRYSYAKLFLITYGLFWFLGGLIYAYAGSYVVFPLLTFLSESNTVIQTFFSTATPFAWTYVLIFTLFTLADLSLSMIGTIFYSMAPENLKAKIVLLALLIAGAFGTIVDIILLSCWQIIAISSLNVSSSLISFWNTFGIIEYFAIWLSAAGFLMGCLGFYALYSLTAEKNIFTRAWRYLTLLASLLSGLSVCAIIYTMLGGNPLVTGILFFFATVVLSPVWSFWTLAKLKNYLKV